MICQCCMVPLNETSVHTPDQRVLWGMPICISRIRIHVRHLLKLPALKTLEDKGKLFTQLSAHPACL